MFAVFKKELKSYLFTPIGYIFIAIFFAVFGIIFYQIVSQGSSLFEYLYYSGVRIIPFIIPVLTMRMFSEERKNGTEQLLLTSPRSSVSIVLGKFFSAAFIVILAEVLSMIYFVILSILGSPSLSVTLTTLLGFLLLSLSFLSMGMFISAITESQIIACVVSIGITFLMFYFDLYIGATGIFNLFTAFFNFTAGMLYISDIIKYLSFILLFILLTIIVIQRRKTIK